MPPGHEHGAANASPRNADRPSASTAAAAPNGAAAAKQAAQRALAGIATTRPHANGDAGPAAGEPRADGRGSLATQQSRAPAAPAARALGSPSRHSGGLPAAGPANPAHEAALQERAGGNSGVGGAAAPGHKAAPGVQGRAHSGPQKEYAAFAGRLPGGGVHARRGCGADGRGAPGSPRNPAHAAAPASSPGRAHKEGALPPAAAGARPAEPASRERAPHVGQHGSVSAVPTEPNPVPGEVPGAGAADAPGAAAAAKKRRRRKKLAAGQRGTETAAAAAAPGADPGEGGNDAGGVQGVGAATAVQPALQQALGSGAGDACSASAVQAADLRDRNLAAAAGEQANEQGPRAECSPAGSAADAQQAEEAAADAQGVQAGGSAAGPLQAHEVAADAQQAEQPVAAGPGRTTLGRDAAGAWEGLAGLGVRWGLARERKLGEDASCQHAANTWAHAGLAGAALL